MKIPSNIMVLVVFYHNANIVPFMLPWNKNHKKEVNLSITISLILIQESIWVLKKSTFINQWKLIHAQQSFPMPSNTN